MKCIAIGNKKGGVGKSTLAVHVGCELASRGYAVTLFDTDEQGTSADWCARGDLPIQCVTAPIEDSPTAEEFIRQLKAREDDFVVVDLPPHTQEATQAAVMACDLFLIPVTASGADFVSTGKAIDLLQEGRSLRGGAPQTLLVPSRVDRRTSFGREVGEALAGFEERVTSSIGQRSVFVDCFGLGDWVGRVDPKSIAYAELQAVTDTILEVL